MKPLFLLLLATLTAGAQSRDSTYLNSVLIGAQEIQALEFGFGAIPPVSLGKTKLIQSFSGQHWDLYGLTNLPDNHVRFSQYRYMPMLLLPLDEKTNLTVGYPMMFSALGYQPRLRNDAFSDSLFISYSKKNANESQWSLGFAVLDRSKRRQLFPSGSYSFASDDRKWRFAFGFPFVAISYFPNEILEVGSFLGRDNSHYLIPEEDVLAAQGRYLKQEQTVVGISGRIKMGAGFKLTVIAASLMSGKYVFTDSSYNELLTFKEYENLGYLKFGLSWAFAPKAAPVKSVD